MTAQELMTLAQRHIRSLTGIIDRLNEIGAQDELRRISLHLTRLASLVVMHEGYCYEGSACATVRPRRVPHGTSGTNSPYGRRSWKCRITAHSVRGIEIASASPAHALRGARNQPRFEASSAWIFRPSYHRQDCALRRTLIATLIERDSTGPTCNEFNCAVPRMF